MTRIRHLSCFRRGLAREEDGAVLTEALLVVPFLTILAVGILEFGNVLWQREQIETGLRDAARYMARCRQGTNWHTLNECEGWARNLAYYGSTAASGPLRVPDWNATNGPITFSTVDTGNQIIITATTSHELVNSPLFGLLGINLITVSADHEQRVVGW
jgi:Flp pilus assembly protein TadG